MSVTYLGFGPPPSGGQTMRLRQVGRCDTDKWINVVEDGGTLYTVSPSDGFGEMNSHTRELSRPGHVAYHQSVVIGYTERYRSWRRR